MKLLSSLAKRIVYEVRDIVNEEVIVVNDQGTIMAASDTTRVGQYHEGALLALQKNDIIKISSSDVASFNGVKAGLNLPIKFTGQPIGVIGLTGDPKNIGPFGELTQRMTELIIQEAYSSERLASKNRGLETFVYEWAHKQIVDRDMYERGEILGIQMDVSRICVLIDIDMSESSSREVRFVEYDVYDELHELLVVAEQDFLIRWGQGRFVLLKQAALPTEREAVRDQLVHCQRTLKKRQNVNVYIAAGSTVQQAAEMSLSYKNAKKALRVAKHHKTTVFYDDLTLDVALAEISDDTRQLFIDRVLGPLKYEPDLLWTLRKYMECELSLKETAKHLHIHINTLHYRLQRIAELTGKRLKDGEQLTKFYIALLFWYEFN
ncbi:CdaR family transcriptional regulator [Texcoconibacillus texcoconensis]|uniref:Carbohydrate diacid regulator n=1 Tax=Texcoconibacillus texcoconensis TaxID=1095777 RepID=A0A840QR96_9BACI|nr:sugar diacid recognition domain-containing protein [Texcoconibacillus texcoconensis]MBB5173986.1 carbohydrate diacid regulator [Texcoconibacillus texcoconensis]